MRNHTCLLDNHQRSHYDTITIGPEGKFNWVLQLINSQKVRLFDSLEENFNTQRSPNMQDVFVVKGETSRSHEINEKGFHEKLCGSDRSGQPEITPSVIEARNLSENTRVEQTHDGSGQPDERNSSTPHTVKEQYAHEVHREIASFNTDNEFNRKINEEDIDFNIPGLPHSTVKQLQQCQRSRIDSENREPPKSTRSSTRPTTKSII